MTSPRTLDHAWILLTVALATYSQLVLRWQMSMLGKFPADLAGRWHFALDVATKPWVISALLATFLSGVTWMVVLNKFELSYAFPFTALNFLLIMVAGVAILGESLSTGKVIGTFIVMSGVLVIALSEGKS